MNIAEEKDLNKRPKKSLEERFESLIVLLKKHGIHHDDDVIPASPAPTTEHESDKSEGTQ